MRGLVRWALPVLVALAALALWPRLDFSEDAADLLPDGPGRGELVFLKKTGLLDRLILTVNAKDPQALAAAVDLCGRELEKSGLFRQVLYRFDSSGAADLPLAVAANLPWLLDESAYPRLAELMDDKRLDAQLARLFLLLNSPQGFAASEVAAADPLGLSGPVLAGTKALAGSLRFVMSDGHLVSHDRRHALVSAESRVALTDSAHAGRIAELVADLEKKLAASGARLMVTGPLPHTMANRATIRRDLLLLLPAASLVLLIFLLIAFRSPAALALFLVPTLAAPPAVLAAGLLFGRLSAIALGFGIVLLGIGVDFAIHLYFARQRGHSPRDLLLPLSAAAATTIGCFVVLLFSSIPVHRQMGWLAIFGLSYALLLAIFLVPTLIAKGNAESFLKLPTSNRRQVPAVTIFAFALWLLVLAGAIFSWPGLRFAGDMRQMDASGPEISRAEKEFNRIWGIEPGEEILIGAIGKDLDAALDNNDRVAAALAGEKGRLRSISQLLPGPRVRAENLVRWQEFWAGPGRGFAEKLERSATRNGFAAGAFAPFLKLIADPGGFSPQRISDSLPAGMGGFFIRKDGPASVMVVSTARPAEEDSAVHALAQLGRGVNLFASGRWRKQMAGEFRRETGALALRALLLVGLVALVFLKSPRRALAAMAPVLAALAAMVIFVRLTSAEMNLMHILMGIMVCGLSVDYGIFMVAGVRESSLRAVSVCAVSTLTGFGVFVLAAHPALSSLGVTTLAGIGAAWPAAIFVTPFLGGRQ